MFLEALAIQHGHKIYDHECYTAFLKELLNKSDMGDRFDKCRKTRNSINYYGETISSDEAEYLIKIMEELIGKVKIMLD